MDNLNSITTTAATQQQQQQQQQQHQQQFCLRWHNHQTSLLSTLPLLLDQSHLTDVTLSAEGKTLRAHRVVLSACSTFFSELFRTLETNFHPVIVIPGASFAAVVALLTFMYSGEVNVFEEQIPTLLTLAETLGIKGLADFQNNNTSKSPRTENNTPKESSNLPSSPPTTKIPSPLENFFMKSFQFYPNILSQPLNFSQSALNKTTELLNKYQQQFSLVHASKDIEEISSVDERSPKRSSSGERKTKDIKRIDKIAENLRSTTNNNNKPCLDALTPKMPVNMAHSMASLVLKPPPFPSLPHHLIASEDANKMTEALSPLEQQQQQQQHTSSSTVTSYPSPENLSTSGETLLDKSLPSPQQKPNNSKLYATCFICHKQLSNQYNLRVHLETHQNVRYACNVCSHVSRSKDALRKHVSYRHPGAPSPCETEARRKRSKGMSAAFPLIKTELNDNRTMTPPTMATNQSPFIFFQNQCGNTGGANATATANSQTSSNSQTQSSSSLGNANEQIMQNETKMKKESTNSD